MNEQYYLAQEENREILISMHQVLGDEIREDYELDIVCDFLGDAAFDDRDRWLSRSRGTPAQWDWREIYRRYVRSYPRRFELSLWHDNKAIALGLGKMSDNQVIARLGYLEGAPANVLQGNVAPVAIRGLELYAQSYSDQIEWIGIQEPLPGLIEYYRSLGFDQMDPFNSNNNALCRRLQEDE